MFSGGISHTITSESQEKLYNNLGVGTNAASDVLKTKDSSFTVTSAGKNFNSRTGRTENLDNIGNLDSLSVPHLETNGLNLMSTDSSGERQDNEVSHELDLGHYKLASIKVNPTPESGPSIPQILHMINGSDGSPSASRRSGLQQLIDASVANDESV